MPTHQILICTYMKDLIWLEPNLKSLRKFCRGFLPPTVCVDEQDYGATKRIIDRVFPEVSLVIKNAKYRQGFMRAQLAMMSCDLICPHADYVYLVGSDCIAWTELKPDYYFHKGKPAMLYNSRKYFEDAQAHAPIQWMDSTAEIVGFPVQGEYMRRLPIVYPKELFAPMRAHVARHHGMDFEEYIYARSRAGGKVSESNILGAYAWEHLHDLYTWVHADGTPEYWEYRNSHPDLIQFWSHGGLDRPAETCVNYTYGNTAGKTPRQIMRELGVN